MQFEIADLKAKLEQRDGAINLLQWELRYRNRRDQIGSWLLAMQQPSEDDPNCS
jgi:hypothetical protein